MSGLTNFTAFPVALSVGRDKEDRSELTVSVKAAFTWDRNGDPVPVDAPPLVEQDQFVGDPASSSIARAGEVGPRRRRVDILLSGALVFRSPIQQADLSLSVGARLAKSLRVHGDRLWQRSGDQVVPSRPRPTSRVPIQWERSFGGTDARDPSCSDRRNPVGSGMARRPRDLEGRPAPSFEDSRHPIKNSADRPAPVGLGPVAPHWEPRIKLAGTYDQAWTEQRCPLPPDDFDAAFFNLAPSDQQLASYEAGERVHLAGMTVAGSESFRLPELRVPVIFRSRDQVFETYAVIDTVIIEPEDRRFSVIARAAYAPRPNVLAMRQIAVGQLTRGRRRALDAGKVYADLRGGKRAR